MPVGLTEKEVEEAQKERDRVMVEHFGRLAGLASELRGYCGDGVARCGRTGCTAAVKNRDQQRPAEA